VTVGCPGSLLSVLLVGVLAMAATRKRGREHFLRSVHGKQAETRSGLVVESPSHAELPEGVAAPVAGDGDSLPPRVGHRFEKASEAAKLAGRKGGIAKRDRNANRWAEKVGVARLLKGLTPDAKIEPFIADSEQWFLAQCAHVAQHVGGGMCSPGVCSIIRMASWQRAFASFLFEAASMNLFAWDVDEKRSPRALPRLDLITAATRIADSSRQSLLSAHSLAAIEAKSRADAQPMGDAAAAMRARLLGDDA
jgi:hypothetical protein